MPNFVHFWVERVQRLHRAFCHKIIGSKNNDITISSHLTGFTTTGGPLPVNVIVSKLKPNMVIYKRGFHPSFRTYSTF